MNTSLDNLTHKMQRAALGKIVDMALSHAEHDREKTMCQLVDTAKQFYGSGFSDETYENAKKVLTDPDSKWTKLINCVLDQTDPHVARTTALNLGYEAFFRGTKMIRENRVNAEHIDRTQARIRQTKTNPAVFALTPETAILQIRHKAPLGLVIRVRDLMADHRRLTGDLTHSCHL